MSPQHRRVFNGPAFWGGLFGITLALSMSSKWLMQQTGWGWITKYPRAWEIPFDKWISTAMTWLVEDAAIGPVSFRDLTRLLSALVEAPYDVVRKLLVDGFFQGQGQQAVAIAPSLSWVAISYGFIALGYAYGGIRLAVITGFCFLYLAVFGQWASAMVTLASVMISVPLGVVCGAALGVAAYRHPRFETLLRPVLDLMQTLPTFVYLIPVVMLFSLGDFPAMVAIVFYALPPAIRYAKDGITRVPKSIIEAADISGCTTWQKLLFVQIPFALPEIMLGLSQTVLMAFGMLVITALVGTRGLEQETLIAVSKARVGEGLIAGLGISFLSIIADRLITHGSSRLRKRLGQS